MVYDLIARLLTRAKIRRQIPTRKSVQEGEPDRLADLLEEAADVLAEQETILLSKIVEIMGLQQRLKQYEEK